MALNLAEQFSRNAEQGLPQWRAYEDMLAERELEAKPSNKIDLNNLNDISEEDLIKTPELLAIKRAKERLIAEQIDGLEDLEKDRKQKQEANARNNQNMREAMEEAAEAAAKRWDNAINDFGGLGLTNKDLLERLRYIAANKEKFRERLEKEGILKPGHEQEYYEGIDQYIAILERRRQREEFLAQGNKLTPEQTAQAHSDDAHAAAIEHDPNIGQGVVQSVRIAEDWGVKPDQLKDLNKTEIVQEVGGINNLASLDNGAATQTAEASNDTLGMESFADLDVPTQGSILPPEKETERTFAHAPVLYKVFAENAKDTVPLQKVPDPIIAPPSQQSAFKLAL